MFDEAPQESRGERPDFIVRPRLSATRLSALSGLGWGLIAYVIGHRVFGYRIWGGLIAAPLIGVLIGQVSRSLSDKSQWAQIGASLLQLYLAASCFAIAMALSDVLWRPTHVTVSATLVQHVLAVLWGLTFGGYVLVFWPLSFFNHWLVWRAEAGQSPAPPQIRLTSTAVRSLALRIMAVAVVGYVAWALLQAILMAVGSPTAPPMPWWALTGLMGWSKWLVFGGLVWHTAPILSFAATHAAGSETRLSTTYAELIAVVGLAVCAFPVLSFTATLIVTALKVSLVQSWATEGTVFWASSYHRYVFWMYLPWFIVGGGMIWMRRLIGDRW